MMTERNFHGEPHDFSLVLGGPIFQLFRRSHLAGDGLELVHRRLLIITLVAWLPLLVLATLGSSAGNAGRLPLLLTIFSPEELIMRIIKVVF
jgi:hypothetical protein